MNPKLRLAAAVGGVVAGLLMTIVTRHEGTVLGGYRDPVGIVTACTGHTATAQMRRYSKQECEELLANDLVQHAEDVNRCVRVSLSPQERAAYVSFAFNVGGERFCASTLVRRLNALDRAGACAELSRWTKAGGKVLPGLVTRRAEERKLCEEGLK